MGGWAWQVAATIMPCAALSTLPESPPHHPTFGFFFILCVHEVRVCVCGRVAVCGRVMHTLPTCVLALTALAPVPASHPGPAPPRPTPV